MERQIRMLRCLSHTVRLDQMSKREAKEANTKLELKLPLNISRMISFYKFFCVSLKFVRTIVIVIKVCL